MEPNEVFLYTKRPEIWRRVGDRLRKERRDKWQEKRQREID